MALSNMLREPRREITETVVGIAGVALVLAVVAVPPWALCYFGVEHRFIDAIADCFLCLTAIVVGVMVLALTVNLIHDAGEALCAALARRGIDPRPRTRR